MLATQPFTHTTHTHTPKQSHKKHSYAYPALAVTPKGTGVLVFSMGSKTVLFGGPGYISVGYALLSPSGVASPVTLLRRGLGIVGANLEDNRFGA